MRLVANIKPPDLAQDIDMKNPIGLISFLFVAALQFAGPVQASPVSYSTELRTSKLNPVTNVLILEQDESGTVHGTVYGSDVSGNGQAVISHNPAFTPRRSLIIGLTDGSTPEGVSKTQIVLYANRPFAASILGVKWSDALPGSSHSATIASLLAATAGDATELAWFTGDFFNQIAAPAVFSTGGQFAVGEFSQYTPIDRWVTIPVPGLGAGAMAALMLLLAGLAAFRLRAPIARRMQKLN